MSTAVVSSQTTPPRIAVIGGGAAGLAAARILQRDAPQVQVTLLEEKQSLGGVWNYQPKATTVESKTPGHKTNPMYAGLRTNLPKELMQFREYPWTLPSPSTNTDSSSSTSTSTSSYMTHGQVLDYLQSYASHFQVKVQYGCSVTNVQLSDPNEPSRFFGGLAGPKFRVDWTQRSTSENTNGKQDHAPVESKESQLFDGVCVCNGHYAKPAVPHIPGLEQYFQGQTLHSIEYDTPQVFADKTVLCIGGRASGADLCRELVPFAEHIYLSDTSCSAAQEFGPKVTYVPETVAVRPDGSVEFANASNNSDNDNGSNSDNGNDNKKDNIHPTVDVIIYCTGYDYAFEFLQNDLVETSQRRVQPLYEQLWHARYPTLAFVGLPHSVVPFPLFEAQMEAYCRQIVNFDQKTSTLPPTDLLLPTSEADRLQAADTEARAGGPFHQRVPQDTHYLGSAQWNYCRRMGQYAFPSSSNEYQKLDQYLATNEQIYNDAGASRKADAPGAADNYRSYCYERLDDQASFRKWRAGEAVAHQLPKT